MPGTLYLVATPIGNLQDITLRALDILRKVDVIACEDTRHTRKLLNHFQIQARTVSYHEHNESERAAELADRLLHGDSIAIVSDAGTPGICDPAFQIVQTAIQAGVAVVPIPGAVAFVNALVASGLGTDSLYFGGFLPARKGERRKRLESVRMIPATLIFYEAPHRLLKSLADCLDILGNRPAAAARELTKLHEEIIRGSVSELASRFSNVPAKGEVVLLFSIAPDHPKPTTASLGERLAELEKEGLDHKAALKKAAREFGIPKSEAYRRVLDEKRTDIKAT